MRRVDVGQPDDQAEPPRTAAGESWSDLPEMVLQPVVDLATGRTVAVETLARFARGDSTEGVFTAIRSAGLGPAMEAYCVRSSRGLLRELPDDVLLAVNVSPDALNDPRVQEAFAGDLGRIIVEVTEQPASDTSGLQQRLGELRSRGARVAVDDVTTGYAGLVRLAELRPDLIKLDRSIAVGITSRVEQVAVVEALVTLARRIGALVLAEGIESPTDLAAVAALDVDFAQGYAIGRPAPRFAPVADSVVELCRATRRRRLALDRPVTPLEPPIRSIHTVTASLAGTAHRPGLDRVLADAVVVLGASQIGLSELDAGDVLHQVVSTGAPLDATGYPLARFPATARALSERVILEVQVDDPVADPSEVEVLRRDGMATLLLVPLLFGRRRLGILELGWQRPHRCTGRDVDLARVLAEHVVPTMLRIDEDERRDDPS